MISEVLIFLVWNILPLFPPCVLLVSALPSPSVSPERDFEVSPPLYPYLYPHPHSLSPILIPIPVHIPIPIPIPITFYAILFIIYVLITSSIAVSPSCRRPAFAATWGCQDSAKGGAVETGCNDFL